MEESYKQVQQTNLKIIKKKKRGGELIIEKCETAENLRAIMLVCGRFAGYGVLKWIKGTWV